MKTFSLIVLIWFGGAEHEMIIDKGLTNEDCLATELDGRMIVMDRYQIVLTGEVDAFCLSE